jgi:hypothetical protein
MGGLQPSELQPCDYYCTEAWLRGHDRTPSPGKPCLVRDGEGWREATLVWEARPRADGLWWAAVRYRRDGRGVTETRNQHDLRPR